MSESFKQTWFWETEDWEIVEFEKKPQALCLNIAYKRNSEVSFHFGSLGIKREKLEAIDKALLNNLLTILGHSAIANDWNVSVSSFWSNLPYCIPDPNDWDEEKLENADPEFVEILTEIWKLIDENDKDNA